MNEILHFKVSSGLKNIIGRELINNKYIAIFELVKNSYDAEAKNVTIKFEKSKISIIDDGNGMNKDDIIKKWLFVAYSEKKNPTYRDKIKKRTYAGAKGVGRFSCDRLGTNVCLVSKVADENVKHKIDVNWNDFEINSQDNFADINVNYQTKKYDSINSGTTIVIKNLRETWTRSDLQNLKKQLTQLINPNATSKYDSFTIKLEAPNEIDKDNKAEHNKDKINGIVKNYIFETLDLKTNMINVEISEDGTTIQTILNDRGTQLFTIKEKNPYSLKNISCCLYYLNRSAKYNFTKLMGVEPVKYGSVFIYKNGFRVSPYGEPELDFFNINKRKAQGYNRYLGTRELLGSIEINGYTNNLNETSSRNNGFINTTHLEQLIDFFYEYLLKPLEKYVVHIIKWSESLNIVNDLLPYDLRNYKEVIKKLKPHTKEENIISINYNEDLLKIIEEKRNPSPSLIVQDLKEIALKKNDNELLKKAVAVENQTKNLEKQVYHAHSEVQKSQEELDKTTSQLKVTKKQVEVLKSRADLTADEAISAMHIIKGYADSIDSVISEVFEEIENCKEAKERINPLLFEISQTCNKIKNSYNLVLNTCYSADQGSKKSDIINFIKDYIEFFKHNSTGSHLKIHVKNENNSVAFAKFNPLEFSIIIDNIIYNSIKANSTELNLLFVKNNRYIDIIFSDNGYGLKNEIADYNNIFNPGYSTTGGTGIGLHTIKQYLNKINGSVKYNSDYKDGFELIVRLQLWT